MKFTLPTNVVALIFSTSGSFCTALGLILMKIANIKVEKTKNKWAILQVEWIIGLVFMALSQTLNACKYKYSLWFLKLSTNIYAPKVFCFE